MVRSQAAAGDGLQSVDRAIRVLNAFLHPPHQWGVMDLVRLTGLPKGAVLRILTSLEQHGLVVRGQEDRLYRIGVAVVDLANVALAGRSLRTVALPVMQVLAKETGESVILTVRSGLEAVCIEKVESTSPLRVTYDPGKRGPLHAGASSRVLLSFLPDDELRAVLEQLRLHMVTPSTPVDRTALERSIHETRALGYVVTHGELDPEASAVAAPILSPGGRLLAGLSCVGPAARFHPEAVAHLVTRVVAAAREIARQLGNLQVAGGE